MSAMRRASMLANLFNLLVAIHFIVISIISLVKLRWYHQLTITTRVRHVISSTTSYFAFLILIFTAIILIIILVSGTISLKPRTYVSEQDAINSSVQTVKERPTITTLPSAVAVPAESETSAKQRLDEAGRLSPAVASRLILKDSSTHHLSQSNLCCSILIHLVCSVSLIVILVVWLLNTGELVRDSIATQLEPAFARYQFANRSNHYSIAIDGMQDINNCCGSLDYTDFPHQRVSQLSSGHYPGSCCGKNIFGVNARVLCTPEEIVKAKQTAGCVTVLANYYDLISILVVPIALACLFVDIIIIALITITSGHSLSQESAVITSRRLVDKTSNAKFELKTVA